MTTAQSPTARLRTPSLLTWLATVAALTFVVFFGGALPFLHIPTARVVVQLLMVLASAAVVILVARRRLDVGTPLAIPAAACIAVVGLSALTSSEPSVSREAFALLLLGATTYPFVRYLVWDPALASRVESLITLAAVALVGLYLFRVVALWTEWVLLVGASIPPMRPAGEALTTGTVNSVATYIELLVPTALWVLHTRRGLWASGPLAIAALIALVVTGSRGAWLGVAIAALAVVAMNWRIVWNRAEAWLAGSRLRSISVVAVLAIAALGIVVALLPRLVGGDGGRFELWSAAVQLGLDRPLLGQGPGTWQDLRPTYAITDAGTAALFTPHNGLLHVFAETGTAGVLTVLILVVAIAVVAIRAVRTAPDTRQLGLTQAASASLVAVGVHSLVDPLFGVPAVAVIAMFLVARLDRPGAGPPTVTGPWPALAIGVATIGAVVFLVPVDVAMARAASGNAALGRAEWSEAADAFDSAVSLDDRPVYRLGQALAAAGLGDIDDARAALAAARRTNRLSFLAASEARMALASGDAEAATRLAHTVLSAGSYDPTATVNAALILFELGDRGAAADGLADAMRAAPSLIYSRRPPTLFDDDTWSGAQNAALASLAESDLAAAAYAAIRGSRSDADVQASLGRLPDGPERRILSLVAEAERSSTVDMPAARDIVQDAPESALVLLAYDRLARLAKSEQDLADARRLSIMSFHDIVPLDHELALDGLPAANYSLRVIGFPTAMTRQGPLRPYLEGMVTIEPVLRH